ncbi:MAG: hypothetical protein V8Q42_03700 [Anaerovoracaceae bacterium]
MNRAKVRDISVDKGTVADGKNAYVTLEEIYNWDPDAMINNESSVTEYILSDTKWKGLSAVKNKKSLHPAGGGYEMVSSRQHGGSHGSAGGGVYLLP